MITKVNVDQPERYLPASVYDRLDQLDLLQVRTEAERYLTLACINLSECAAYNGAQLQSKLAAFAQSRQDDLTLTDDELAG